STLSLHDALPISGPLAAGERAHRLEHAVASKREPAEKVARVLLAELRIDREQMRDRRGREIERVDLVLREVADREMGAAQRFAAHRLELAGEELDQRRLAGAVRAEEPDALAGREAQVDRVEHGPAGVADRHVVEADQRLRQPARRTKLEVEAGLGVHRRDLRHPLDHLDPGLRLPRLARLRTEPVDEALEVRDAPLLRFVRRGLARELRGPLRL